MKFAQMKIRVIHEVSKYLCSYNANFFAIFSPYNRGRVIIEVVLFWGLYGKSQVILLRQDFWRYTYL